MAAGLVGIGASLLGGFLGSSAAKSAADAQVKASTSAVNATNAAKDQALNTQGEVYSTDQGAIAPYQATGAAALGQIGTGIEAGGEFNNNPTADQIMANDPGYQFRIDQGQQALERGEAAGGSVGSGGALKAAAEFGQNFASNEYGAAYNRFKQGQQQRFGELTTLAGMGQTANNQQISAGQNYANQSGQIDMNAAREDGEYLTGAGNAQAAGDMGTANAWSGALGGIGKAASGINFGSLFKKSSSNDYSDSDGGS